MHHQAEMVCWVAQQMGTDFQSKLFAFRVVIAPATYATTAPGVLATLRLAALPAVRRVNHLNLAEATRVLTSLGAEWALPDGLLGASRPVSVTPEAVDAGHPV